LPDDGQLRISTTSAEAEKEAGTRFSAFSVGPAVDSKRSRRSVRSRHAWENQRGREFVSWVEAAVVEAAIVPRHDFTTGTIARPQNSECRVKY